MFSRFSIFLIFGIFISTFGFSASDKREPFRRFMVGEYLLVDETAPVVAKRADGSLTYVEPIKFAGLKISETKKPFVYKISFEGESESSNLKISPETGDLKITDFDTMELVTIKFGDMVVTRWSNSETGESVELVIKDTLSPYSPEKGLSLYSTNGDDIQIYLEDKHKPEIRVAFEDRAKLFPNKSLSCTEIAGIVCSHGADGMERVYCAVDVEKECYAARAETPQTK